MKLKCLVVDDEPLAYKVLESYCEDLPNVAIVGNCKNALQAIDFLQKNEVDLLFLDIRMPKLDGLSFLKSLPKAPCVIITTAYQEYALDGYELNVCDYLLKPFSFERFIKAVNKAAASIALQHHATAKIQVVDQSVTLPEPAVPIQNIFIKGDKKIHNVATGSILYLESYGSYVKIYLEAGMILTHEKLSNFEKQLMGNGFIRIHKSFIVAIDKIQLIEGNRVKINEQSLPIGNVYKAGLIKLIGK